MARNSLVVAVVLAVLPSCLVTGSPDFEEATPTRPYLTVVAPAVTELLRVELVESKFPQQQFSVQVTSEDADERLEATLLIDYGDGRDVGAAVGEQPYQEDLSPQVIPAGTMTDGPRLVTLTWVPPTLKTAGTPECHSVTMMVVRRRYGSSPYAWCPTDDHFATVTWYVALCPDPGSCSFQSCPTKGQDSYQYCPNPSELGQPEATP